MPVSQTAHLRSDLFSADAPLRATREGYGDGLLLLGERNPRVAALSADLAGSTCVLPFARRYPERFIQVGVAEQDLVTVSAGLAAAGKIPYASSFAAFMPGRTWEQIRTTICYNDVPVKLIGSHAGLSVGKDGATHQMLEDVALMRALPNMEVFAPCDALEAWKITEALADTGKPAYMRLGRNKTPVITTDDTPFAMGAAQVFWEGKDVAVFAMGPMVVRALRAAQELEREGVGCTVVNCATIKPLDIRTIVQWAHACGCAVSVEEHQIAGGMGSAIAELLAKAGPVPMEFAGVRDSFGESGTADELLEKYGLGVRHIKEAIQKALSRKDNAK